MSEATSIYQASNFTRIPLKEEPEVYKYSRLNWYKAGIDNYTNPPGQNPDRFLQLTNIHSPMTNNLLRRWGYRSFKPEIDNGLAATSDEKTPSANASAVIKARRLYDYENQSAEIRTLIATAGDATGSSSLTNNVVFWDSSGTAQTVFTPSANAISPRAVNSRDWEYFVDGEAGDIQKVFISATGAVIPFVLSAAGANSSGDTTYTGVGLDVLGVGQSVTISGFVTHAAQNNGTFTVVNSSPTTLTVNNSAGLAESNPALVTITGKENWGIVAPTTALTVGTPTGGGAISLALSAAEANDGTNTVYDGTGLGVLIPGTLVDIEGFVTNPTQNNGTFTVVSSTSTQVKVNNPAGLAETNPATLVTTNAFNPTTSLNGWAGNAHLSLGGNYVLSLISSSTAGYVNPNNAVDSDDTTFAYAVGEAANSPRIGCVWAFAALTSGITNATLNVLSEVPISGTDGHAVGGGFSGVYVSLDGGNSWQIVYGSQTTRSKQWDVVQIPDGQDYSLVQVMALTWPLNHFYHKVYTIKIEGETVGNSPVTLVNGRTYYYVYGNQITEHWSDLSPASASTLAVEGGAMPLSNIIDSTDPQVTTKALLATADGNDPSILYLVALIPNGVTTYLDSTSELVLLTGTTFLFTDSSGNEYGVTENDIPPVNGQFPTKHAGRLWLLSGPFLQYSKSVAELVTNTGFIAGRYEEAWPPEFQIDISEVSEIGKGLLSDGQTLYVGTSRHIRRVTGDSPSNFSPAQVVFRDVGLLNQDVWSIVYIESTPIGAMWMTPDHRVILSDFNSYTDVGLTIQTTLATINKAAEQNSWACFLNDGPYNYYLLAIPTGINTDPDTLCVFDTRIKEWFIWSLADKVDAGLFYFNLFGVPRWFFIDSAGKPRLFDKTTFQDRSGDTTPVAIAHTIQTTWLDLGDGNARKAINEIELITTMTGSLVSLDGATTSADFASPISVLSSSSLIQDILNDWKVFPTGASATSRFYRVTITGASTAGSAVADELLGGLVFEVMPIHKY